MAPVTAPAKYDTSPSQSRTSNSSSHWSRQQSYRAPQHDSSERKQLLAAPAIPPSQDRRLVQVPALNPISNVWPIDTKLSKSQKSYGIYPSLTSDIYIYERSITSASFDDELASSPSSDSSDSDHFPHTATFASVEVSSTRASSSTETLESTLTARAPGTHPNVVASVPPPLSIAAAPRPPSTRPRHDSTHTARPVIPVTHTQSQLQRSISVSRVVPPIALGSAPLDNLSDGSDSDTAVSDTHIDGMVVDMLGAHLSGPSSYPYSGRDSAPFRTRRDSTDRVPSNSYRRDAPLAISRDVPVTRSASPPSYQRSQHRDGSPRADDAAYPRAPPGLTGGAGGVATPPDGSPPRGTADPSSSSSPNGSPTSRSGVSAPALTRTTSTRPGPAIPFPGPQAPARNAEAVAPSMPVAMPYPTTLTSTSPPRRDGRAPSPQGMGPLGTAHTSTHTSPTSGVPGPGALVVATPKRNVRWNENLVCPSPVPPEQRRKGWFNRRG